MLMIQQKIQDVLSTRNFNGEDYEKERMKEYILTNPRAFSFYDSLVLSNLLSYPIILSKIYNTLDQNDVETMTSFLTSLQKVLNEESVNNDFIMASQLIMQARMSYTMAQTNKTVISLIHKNEMLQAELNQAKQQIQTLNEKLSSTNSNVQKLEPRMDFLEIEDIDKVGSNGKTKLFSAIEEGKVDVVKYLLSKGASPNITCNNKAPLIEACQKNNEEIVRALIENKAKVNALFNRQNCLWHTTSPEITKILIENGATVESKLTRAEKTLIHDAVEKRNLEKLKVLLEHQNKDKNKEDKSGNTPLHIACEKGYLEIVKYLIEVHHVDATKTNKAHSTPYQLAKDNGRKDVMKYLESKGIRN